jgi:ATP-binding cassette subfamily F protein 3
MHSVDLLIEALNRYEGSYILVSHDRYFISKTANKIWSIDQGKISEFKGGYEEWVQWNERMLKAEQQKNKSNNDKQVKENDKTTDLLDKSSKSKSKNVSDTKIHEQLAVENNKPVVIDKEKQKEQKRLQKRFTELEELVASLGAKQKETEAALANPEIYSDRIKFQQAEKEYQQITRQLIDSEKEYEKVFEQMTMM